MEENKVHPHTVCLSEIKYIERLLIYETCTCFAHVMKAVFIYPSVTLKTAVPQGSFGPQNMFNPRDWVSCPKCGNLTCSDGPRSTVWLTDEAVCLTAAIICGEDCLVRDSHFKWGPSPVRSFQAVWAKRLAHFVVATRASLFTPLYSTSPSNWAIS